MYNFSSWPERWDKSVALCWFFACFDCANHTPRPAAACRNYIVIIMNLSIRFVRLHKDHTVCLYSYERTYFCRKHGVFYPVSHCAAAENIGASPFPCPTALGVRSPRELVPTGHIFTQETTTLWLGYPRSVWWTISNNSLNFMVKT